MEPESVRHANGILILCRKEVLAQIVDELNDWQEEVRVMQYGMTNKATNGFILLEQVKPLSALFHEKLQIEHDIIDYIIMGAE